MTSIQLQDLDSLAEKLSSLDLTEGEAVALDALLSIGAAEDDDDVAGFELLSDASVGNRFTGPGLAGSLTGSGLFSMMGAGTELRSTERG